MYTRISFSSLIDFPEIIHDAWNNSSCSLAMLVYVDNNWLNIYDRSLE